MNQKFLKIYYIVAGSLAGLAVLYYVARLIDALTNENDISDTFFGKLNIVAIIFLALALLMLIAGTVVTAKKEKKKVVSENNQQKDQELLAKYKSKKK